VVDGSSLPDQARECRSYCERHGLTLGEESNYDNPGVFSDPGVSAWKIPLFERPGFQQLWFACKPGDNIAFLSLDRAFRSVHDFSHTWPKFQKAEINPIFVSDQVDMQTATGRLMAHVMASFAQYKSELISQRVRDSYRFRGRRKKHELPPSRRQSDDPLLAEVHKLGEPPEPKEQEKVGRVFGYVRVSRSVQDMEAQTEQVNSRIDQLCADGLHDADEVFVDHGVSAFAVDWKHRPAGSELHQELRSGDCIVVSRVDRLFRSVRDMAISIQALSERGVSVVTCCGVDTRSEIGLQLIELLAMMASWESRASSVRIRLALKHRRLLKGKWHSARHLPYWMKSVDDPVTGEWAAHPNMVAINEMLEAEDLLNLGLSQDKVADTMESRVAKRQNRPVMPRNGFDPDLIMRRAHRGKMPSPHKQALKDWLSGRPRVRNGMVLREWTRCRVKDLRRDLCEVREVLDLDDWVDKPMQRFAGDEPSPANLNGTPQLSSVAH